jgi:hypothetical protein
LQRGNPNIGESASSGVEEFAATPSSFVAEAALRMEAESSSRLHWLHSFLVDESVASRILAGAKKSVPTI